MSELEKMIKGVIPFHCQVCGRGLTQTEKENPTGEPFWQLLFLREKGDVLCCPECIKSTEDIYFLQSICLRAEQGEFASGVMS